MKMLPIINSRLYYVHTPDRAHKSDRREGVAAEACIPLHVNRIVNAAVSSYIMCNIYI